MSSLNRTSVGLKVGVTVGPGVGVNAGLNRTSVGLKEWFGWSEGEAISLPQSNQRGIESKKKVEESLGIPLSLNRTSVGLKAATTFLSIKLRQRASIEPAWD